MLLLASDVMHSELSEMRRGISCYRDFKLDAGQILEYLSTDERRLEPAAPTS